MKTQMNKSISSNIEKHPDYHKKFSEMIKETFEKYKEKRISEKEYLEAMYEYAKDYEAKEDVIGYPEEIRHNPHARAFYGSLQEELKDSKADYVVEDGKRSQEIL